MPSFKITQILTVASLLLVDSTVTAVRSFNAVPKHAQLRRRDASFEPRMDGNDLIYVEDFNGFSAPAAVRLSLSPKMPTLIHDDISDHVVEVSCADSTILVKFHGEESMLRARDAWNTNSDFVFVTSQPGCASVGEHAAYVVSYAAATAQSITLKSSPSTLRDSTHNMYVNLGRHIVSEVEPREMSRIMRRSPKEMAPAAMPPAPSSSAPAPPVAAAPVPADNLTATATTIYRTAESPLTQTYNWSPPTAQPTTADVVADISFERIDTVLLPPSEEIAALLPAADIIENFELRCANCSLTGTLELDVAGFNIDSNAFEQITEFVQDGTFEFVANNVFGTFEFDFVIQEGFSVPLFDGLLPPIPLTPFAIPGVVNFGPALELTFPIAITLDKDVVFTTGFTLDVPDGSRVVLNVGDIGASNSTGFQDSVLEPIPFSTNAGDLSVTLSAGFRPQLVISAEVGNDLIANIGGGVGAFLDVPELSLTISSLQNQNPTCDGPAPAGEENTRLLVEAAATLRAGAFFELEVGVGLLDFGIDGEQELASVTFPLTSQCLLFNSETSSTEPGPQVPVPEAAANATEAAPQAPAAEATKAAPPKPAAEATQPPKHMMPQASAMATSKPMTKRETGAASSFYVPTCVIALIGTAIGFANLLSLVAWLEVAVEDTFVHQELECLPPKSKKNESFRCAGGDTYGAISAYSYIHHYDLTKCSLATGYYDLSVNAGNVAHQVCAAVRRVHHSHGAMISDFEISREPRYIVEVATQTSKSQGRKISASGRTVLCSRRFAHQYSNFLGIVLDQQVTEYQHLSTMVAHPDSAVHPQATGKAAAVVTAHQKEEPLILYSGWFCPFVQRSWIVLEEKKIPYQYREINPYNKEPSFLALNPRGLVPTLAVPQSGNNTQIRKPLIESNIICDYLEETYPESATKLYPSDTYEKARLRIWIDFVGSRIIPSFHRFLQHTEKSPYSLQSAREEFHGHLKTWIRESDPTGPFFAGEELTMTDIALAPWAVRLWVFDHYKDGGLGLPEEGKGGEDEEVWQRWRKWVQAVQSRPSVQHTLSETEYYLPLYQRYAEDKSQSELAKATRAGRGVP